MKAGGRRADCRGETSWAARLAAKIVVCAYSWWSGTLPSRCGFRLYLPTPLGVASAFVPTLLSEKFQFAVAESSLAIIVGLVIGAALGTVFGLLSGRMRWLRELMSPYINGLYALPLLAIVPPVTIWLGYSGDARMALIIVAAFLPCAVSTADGARNVPASLEDVVEVYRGLDLPQVHRPGPPVANCRSWSPVCAWPSAGRSLRPSPLNSSPVWTGSARSCS